jgi:DNA-directed RNA polymerase specialized sigma24 family protein
VFEIAQSDEHKVEPSLAPAVARLPERQRDATMLIFGAGWTNGEFSALLGINPSMAQKHAERGLAALRRRITGGTAS